MADSHTSSNASTPRTHVAPNLDDARFSVGQSISSVLNNPRAGKTGHTGVDSQWAWIFPNSNDNAQEILPPFPPGIPQDIQQHDFEAYLNRFSDLYGKFNDVREHSKQEERDHLIEETSEGREGGVSACLREIPPLFFDSSFTLEDGSTFQAVCPTNTVTENMMLQEKLTHYLDLVEGHLVREISSRSGAFVQALAHLEDLHSGVVQAVHQIAKLKESVGFLEENLVESARRVQLANSTRENILALEQKLKLISFVEAALSTLRMVTPNLSPDFPPISPFFPLNFPSISPHFSPSWWHLQTVPQPWT